MNLSSMAARFGRLLTDNSPVILTAIGVAGTLTTAYLAGQASFKAARIIEEQQKDVVWDLSSREKIELTWQLYIPAAGSAVTTIACIIAANHIGHRRAVAMAAAYAISERAFDEYRNKIVEKIGEKREQAARDEIAQDRVARTEMGSREVVIVSGDVLCYDAFSGRYFTSNMERLRQAQNEINHQVLNDYHASLTEFYQLIGLSPTSLSEEVGWNSDRLLELKFSTVLAGDGRPAISFDFVVSPIRNYYRLQ